MNSEGGYSSITVLIIILFLSSITLSVLIFLQISARQNAKREYFYSEKEILDDEVNALIEQLAKDPTAEADSQFDPVWDYIETRNKDKTTLTLEDISSRFNLNFIRTKMLENSSFRELLINGHTSEDLKLYRGEQGFFSSISEGYGEYFEEEDLQKYFTTFSYANLNVTYEDSLKKLYEYRVSEEGSHSFLNEIQQLISETQMADQSRLKNILGNHFDTLYPLINIEPLMNINFMDEKTLYAVLNYPYGGETHKNSRALYEILNTERVTMEIDGDHLKSVLAVEEDYLRILEYLGPRTWFWRIWAVMDSLTLEVILCRSPDSEDKDEKKYQVITWKYHNS